MPCSKAVLRLANNSRCSASFIATFPIRIRPRSPERERQTIRQQSRSRESRSDLSFSYARLAVEMRHVAEFVAVLILENAIDLNALHIVRADHGGGKGRRRGQRLE